MAGSPPRRDSVFRAFATIDALSRHRGVTDYELRLILKMKQNWAAHQWIDAAGYFLPVVEIGTRRNHGATVGPEAIVYGLLK